MQRFGLDFGTTNSSLAWARAPRTIDLCDLDLPAVNPHVLRSLLYYSPDQRGFVVGHRAIEGYLQEDMRGTLIQSIKTFLADNSFEQTWITDRFYRLEDLVAVVFQHVRQVVRTLTDDEDVLLIIGRPAVFVDRPEREELARTRLSKAGQLAGFFRVDFQYEPIAAGLAYEASLRQPEIALIADFGGGTSDFTVMRLGGSRHGDRRVDILASGGVQIGGDTFDARIMAQRLAKHFGAGTTFRSMEGRDMPFPKMLLAQLGQWHHVPFLRNPKTREQLRRIHWTSSAPETVAAFQTLVEGNYAFFLFQEIEQAKSRLSDAEEALIRFHRDDIHIDERLTRTEFEQLIARDQSTIQRCMQSVLDAAQVRRADIRSVFMTGGSAQIPAIRRLFAAEYGEEKIRTKDFLTSVAVGLGLTAASYSGAVR